MSTFAPTPLQERILAFIRDWEVRYGVACDRYGIRSDLQLDIDTVKRELGELQRTGMVRINGKGDAKIAPQVFWRRTA